MLRVQDRRPASDVRGFDSGRRLEGKLTGDRAGVRVDRPVGPTLSFDHARGTIVTMTTDSLRNVKDRFSEFVDRVEREHERVVVTRNGRPAAVLISLDDLDSLEATLEVLSDSEAVRGLIEAEAAVAAGEVVRGVDAVKALRPSTSR